jgi:hypothetical protein
VGEKAKPEIESAGKLVTSISFASAGTTGCAEAPKNDIACSLLQRGGRGELIAFKKKLEVCSSEAAQTRELVQASIKQGIDQSNTGLDNRCDAGK